MVTVDLASTLLCNVIKGDEQLPFIRGRVIPETESTGRVKRALDVLLWLTAPENRNTIALFDELEQLRAYLNYFQPPICSIRLLVRANDHETAAVMIGLEIGVRPVQQSEDITKIPKSVRDQLDKDLQAIAATALACDADCVVTDVGEWLPYAEEFEKLGVLLTSPDFLLRYAEIFVRGHDLPWAFAYKVWFEPWIAFYQLSEEWAFAPGLRFLKLCQERRANSNSVEIGRSLIYNRLDHLCFTRDRLLFYEMQQAAARRAQWKRQRFSAEIAYYLNFYYLLLYGAFDHAAVLVNGLLNLGVDAKRVSARNPEFLKLLNARAPGVHAVFQNPTHTAFINRVATVRHIAAHRGVITPTKVLQKPDLEPTVAELDEDIRKAGLDWILTRFPPSPARDQFREMLRNSARMARYEQETLMEDVILVELDGKWSFIHPLTDTWWNFKCCKAFLDDIFSECSKVL
jgi:hypothetical protein